MVNETQQMQSDQHNNVFSNNIIAYKEIYNELNMKDTENRT